MSIAENSGVPGRQLADIKMITTEMAILCLMLAGQLKFKFFYPLICSQIYKHGPKVI